jgi:hypothetical protein
MFQYRDDAFELEPGFIVFSPNGQMEFAVGRVASPFGNCDVLRVNIIGGYLRYPKTVERLTSKRHFRPAASNNVYGRANRSLRPESNLHNVMCAGQKEVRKMRFPCLPRKCNRHPDSDST